MARETVSTYDPKEVVVTFGAIPLDGYADGTFVEVAPAGEAFARHVGADGEVSRSKSNDNTHDVTLTLKSGFVRREQSGPAHRTRNAAVIYYRPERRHVVFLAAGMGGSAELGLCKRTNRPRLGVSHWASVRRKSGRHNSIGVNYERKNN